MRRLAVFAICLLMLVPALDAAQAAGGKGSVSKSWVSESSGGAKATTFSVAKVKRLYANFVWKTPATPGQKLRIEWHDSTGTLRAVWDNKTIAGDKKDTRLYAWIGAGVVKSKLGKWSAVLTVGGTRISTAKFRVTA